MMEYDEQAAITVQFLGASSGAVARHGTSQHYAAARRCQMTDSAPLQSHCTCRTYADTVTALPPLAHFLSAFSAFNTHTAHASDGKSPYTVLSWDSLSRQYFHCLALGLEGYCLNLHFSLALTYLLPFFVRSACTRLPQPSWLWAIRQQHQQQQSSFYGHYTGQPASAGTYS